VLAGETAGTLELGKCRVSTLLLTEKVIATLPRPMALANDRDAFAFALNLGSMWPRFRKGRMLAVSPAAEVKPGDDVLVRLEASASGVAFTFLVAELVSRTDGHIMLRQFNPDASFTIPAGAIGAVQKVMGELI
jgi:phage repressor protein C with HTH and peptisase S24 domain